MRRWLRSALGVASATALVLSLFVPNAAADCESKLSGRALIPEVTEVLVSGIQRQNVSSRLVARPILETLTSVEPKVFSWNEYAFDLVRRLHSIQRWRPLIDRVTWYGHDYKEHHFAFSHLIVNSFWGQPLNLHQADWAFVSLFQFAERTESRLSLALGPYTNPDQIRSQVEPLLSNLFPYLIIESQLVSIDDRQIGYLILRGIPQEPTGLEFAERLVSRLQDRR